MRTIQNVPQSMSVEWGQAIQLDFEFSDGQTELFRVPFERTPRLVHAIYQAAMAAEKQRKLYTRPRFQRISRHILRRIAMFWPQ